MSVLDFIKKITRPYRLRRILQKDINEYNGSFLMEDIDFEKKYIDKTYTNKYTFREKGKRKHVIFVIELLSPRVMKMAKYLELSGWEVIAVISKNCKISSSSNNIKKYFSEVIEYATLIELCSILHYFKNKVALVHYHTFLCDNISVLIKHGTFFPPIVMERYDIQNGLYTIKDERTKWKHSMEKYTIEHANGICQREFALDYLEKANYKISRNRITFLDYIDETIESPITSDDNDELSFVYAGGVATDRNVTALACNIEAAIFLQKKKCHYHMYPSGWDDVVYREFIELDKKSEYFHFHKPLPYEELLKEISKYDYVIVPLFDDYKDVKNNEYTENKFIYASTNKYFDAIAAGLPIVAKIPTMLLDLIDEHGVALKWTMNEMDFDFLKKNKQGLKKKVIENRDYWLMSNRIHELIDFYERVACGRF